MCLSTINNTAWQSKLPKCAVYVFDLKGQNFRHPVLHRCARTLEGKQMVLSLVVLSWISFLIPPYIVPGRMVLLVTILLVLFSTSQSV